MEGYMTRLNNVGFNTKRPRKRKCVSNSLKCYMCYFYAKSLGHLELHLLTHYYFSDVDKPSRGRRRGSRSLKCNRCNFYAKSTGDLQLHQEIHAVDDALLPKKRPRIQPRIRGKFASHRSTHEPLLTTVAETAETAVIGMYGNSSTEALQEANVLQCFQCSDCNFYGRSQEELLLHLWTHEDTDSDVDGEGSDIQGEIDRVVEASVACVGDTVFKVDDNVAKDGTSRYRDCDTTDVDDPVMKVTTLERLKQNTDGSNSSTEETLQEATVDDYVSKCFQCIECNFYGRSQEELELHVGIHEDCDIDDSSSVEIIDEIVVEAPGACVRDTVRKVDYDVAKYDTGRSRDCDTIDVDDPVMDVTASFNAERLKKNTDSSALQEGNVTGQSKDRNDSEFGDRIPVRIYSSLIGMIVIKNDNWSYLGTLNSKLKKEQDN